MAVGSILIAIAALRFLYKITLKKEWDFNEIIPAPKGGEKVNIRATHPDGKKVDFYALVRVDTPQEALYYRHGGILQYVLRLLLSS